MATCAACATRPGWRACWPSAASSARTSAISPAGHREGQERVAGRCPSAAPAYRLPGLEPDLQGGRRAAPLGEAADLQWSDLCPEGARALHYLESPPLSKAKRIKFVRRLGKCLHLYHYLIHPDFGFMHVRLYTWMPYQIQVYVNGREWLGRQLDRARLKYTRADNCFPYIADVPRAQQIMDSFLGLPWRSLLDNLAQRVHPYLPQLLDGYDARYDWAMHQSEWASDVMFRDPDDLAAIYSALVRHAISDLGSRDVMLKQCG